MKNVKVLSREMERAINQMKLGDCVLTGVTKENNHLHIIHVTIETGEDRYDIEVSLVHSVTDNVTNILVSDSDIRGRFFDDKCYKRITDIIQDVKMLVTNMYNQRMLDVTGEITNTEHQIVGTKRDEPKQYFTVTFKIGDVFCVNIAHAAKESDVRVHYDNALNIRKANESEVEEAKRKHMPIREL